MQECWASTCLNPTTIAYQSGSTGWSSTDQTAGSNSTTPIGPWYGDFNGDGRTDILYAVYTSKTTDGQGYYIYTMELWASLASGTGYAAGIDTGISITWDTGINTFQALPMIGKVISKGQDQIL